MEPVRPSTSEEQAAFVDAALERGEALRKSGQCDEGIRVLIGALSYQVHRATIYFRLGNLYIDKGDLERAEQAYNLALEIDPEHASALHNLAIVYKRQKRVHLFVRTYKKSRQRALHFSLDSPGRKHGRPRTRSYGLWLLAVVVLVLVSLVIAHSR
jgi:tetratricopeptide (TPR) repeat protein